MWIIIIFGVGVLAGCVVTKGLLRLLSVGTLRIDTSDPDDGPYMFLELSKDMGNIASKKYVFLKVSLKNFIPHK